MMSWSFHLGALEQGNIRNMQGTGHHDQDRKKTLIWSLSFEPIMLNETASKQ